MSWLGLQWVTGERRDLTSPDNCSVCRSITAQYLNFQYLRRSQGFPPELARPTDPWTKHSGPQPPGWREPSATLTSGFRGPEGIVKRGKISSDGLRPLLSGPSSWSPARNTEDNYRNMERNGPHPNSARYNPHWEEENFHESQSSTPWSRSQFQDPGFTDRNPFTNNAQGSFRSPGGFGRYDSGCDPTDQYRSRMNSNTMAQPSAAPTRSGGRARARRY